MENKDSRFWQTGLLIGLILDALHYTLMLLVGRFPFLFNPFGYFIYSIMEPISLYGILILPIVASHLNFAIYGIVVGKILDFFKFKAFEKQEKTNKILILILIFLVAVWVWLNYLAKVDLEKLYS